MTTPAINTFAGYSAAAESTAIYPDAGEGSFQPLTYAVLGLANEAGEVAGKLKKIIRDHGGHFGDEAKAAIAAEAGDVLWYLDRVAVECGTTLEVLAIQNAAKLADRKERGVLKGSGDNR